MKTLAHYEKLEDGSFAVKQGDEVLSTFSEERAAAAWALAINSQPARSQAYPKGRWTSPTPTKIIACIFIAMGFWIFACVKGCAATNQFTLEARNGFLTTNNGIITFSTVADDRDRFSSLQQQIEVNEATIRLTLDMIRDLQRRVALLENRQTNTDISPTFRPLTTPITNCSFQQPNSDHGLHSLGSMSGFWRRSLGRAVNSAAVSLRVAQGAGQPHKLARCSSILQPASHLPHSPDTAARPDPDSWPASPPLLAAVSSLSGDCPPDLPATDCTNRAKDGPDVLLRCILAGFIAAVVATFTLAIVAVRKGGDAARKWEINR